MAINKRQKCILIKNIFTGYSDEGEEQYEQQEVGVLYGSITFASSTETYSSNGNDIETLMKIHVPKIVDVSFKDVLRINGRDWQVIAEPERWENLAGYRSVTVITAKKVGE